MKTIAALSWFLTAGALASDAEPQSPPGRPLEIPALEWATVNIPYAELKALWQAAEERAHSKEPAEEKPPLDAVLLSSQYELVIQSDRAVIEAVYRARSLSDGWHAIPLLGGDVRLEHAELDEIDVVWQNNSYCLLMHGRGDSTIRLRFALLSQDDWAGERHLILRPGPASLNSLRVSQVPDRKVVQIQGMAVLAPEDGITPYHLPAACPELLLSLRDDKPLEPVVPSEWRLQSELLVGYMEGTLRYQARVQAQADAGSGTAMTLLLPANVMAVEVNGGDLLKTSVGPRENTGRTVNLAWKTRDVLDRTIEVSYAVPQPLLSTNWILHAPQTAEGGEALSLFVVLPMEGLELAGVGLKSSQESRRLPEWLRERVGSRDFQTAESGAAYSVQVTALARVQTALATIRRAEYQSRLVTDGGLLVSAMFRLEHQAPFNWRVRLPSADQILTCQVNGHPVQPIHRDPQEIEFALAAPGGQATEVAFSYATRADPLDPVSGKIELQLPRTDLFIHELDWALTIPPAYETTAISGNLQLASAPHPGGDPGHDSGNVVRLQKELVQGEAPVAEVYYQRRGLAGGN